MKIKRALLSVWDKREIIILGKFLANQNIEILSTGGTQALLEDAGLEIRSICSLTRSEEVMNGRVKTLHPKVFGGILADRNNPNHLIDLKNINGLEIDLIVVNFYPFYNEAVMKNLDFHSAIDFIDIGGPSMLRAAAKNYHSVLAICNPDSYTQLIDIFRKHNGEIPLDYRKKCASTVFSMTSQYDSVIANYFIEDICELPEKKTISLEKSADLRYGENPHQIAAFYMPTEKSTCWNQHQGKELSYNNYSDIETAYSIVNDFSDTACAIVKHANPCGFGLGDNPKRAFMRAVSTDPVSYFGGIIGFNREVDSDIAQELVQPFLECIIAPSYSKKALEIFRKKKNLRIVSVLEETNKDNFSIKSVAGGFLYQKKDMNYNELDELALMTTKIPTDKEYRALKLGWKLVKYVKSNAIVIADNHQALGIGAGQMSRIDATKIAIRKVSEAGLNLMGSIMASDAFLPFEDCVELAAKAGISAIIQPGGSVKDKVVIAKANELDVAIVFTGIRHFLH